MNSRSAQVAKLVLDVIPTSPTTRLTPARRRRRSLALRRRRRRQFMEIDAGRRVSPRRALIIASGLLRGGDGRVAWALQNATVGRLGRSATDAAP